MCMQPRTATISLIAAACGGGLLATAFSARATAQIAFPREPHVAYPKVDYDVQYVSDKGTSTDPAKRLEDQLSGYGKLGWELIQTTTLKGKQVMIFRRAGQ